MSGRAVPETANRQDWPRLVAQSVKALFGRVSAVETRATALETITPYTVATLGAAGTAGRRRFVTDATAPTFLGTLTGGGTVKCWATDNGTAWVAG